MRGKSRFSVIPESIHASTIPSINCPGSAQKARPETGGKMSAIPEFHAANDLDSLETQEWLEALEGVIEREGPERAHFLLESLIDAARRSGAYLPFSATTAYINSIPPHLEERSPGDHAIEERIRSFTRWNALAMVAKANKGDGELGGHLSLIHV
jgi:pyruvate dehydrogenase complex dehydrogenase (E1) component